MIGLTKAAAVEYAPHGIRVNATAPGLTRSEMVDQWFAADPRAQERARSSASQGRAAGPEEVAEAAAWLCSDQASFVTGATLTVDGRTDGLVMRDGTDGGVNGDGRVR